MKKLFVFLPLLSLIVSGCTFNVDVLTPTPPATDSGSSQLTPPAIPNAGTPVATISATADPASATPTLVSPVFYGAVFVNNAGISPEGKIFPAGIKQVYVNWNYLSMRPGLTVKREWYLNGQLWLTREEPWDIAKYGENGTTQSDVSIYDFDNGLPSGIYELRLSIDDVLQPIGGQINGQEVMKATFEIRSQDESQAPSASPDFQWAVEVFGGGRIVLEDKYRNPKQIFTAREVPYMSWFADSKHFLFVDRDRSGQQQGTSIGIRDDLWIVDVPSGDHRLLYKSETSFDGIEGPIASPDGKYIASLEGSGYGDACGIDTHLLFLQLNSDFIATNVINQHDFSGLPMFNEGMVYPANQGDWQTGNSYRVILDATCNSDKSKLGLYTFNLANYAATQSSSTQPIPGDLGVGMIHGIITDVNGAPIRNVAVTCEQHSYTSSPLCSGTVLSNANGAYAFNNVYFHDTDTIKLTLQAAGYQSQEFSWNAFTTNDFPVDFILYKNP